jgi:hypothetical protein
MSRLASLGSSLVWLLDWISGDPGGDNDRTAASHVYPPGMSAGKDKQERVDRDRERSREAHWRAAEAGAEQEDRTSEGRRQPRDQDDGENEGGALDRDSDEAADDRQED